jgi:hypothetical protein
MYILVASIYILMPPAQQDAAGVPPAAFLESLALDSRLYFVGGLVFGLGSLLGIAAVLGISQDVRSINEGWVRWTSILAMLGFATNAIDSFRRISVDPARAAVYLQADAATRAALTIPGTQPGLDPQAWLRMGAIGLWVLVVSMLALRAGIWTKTLAYLGVAVAIVYWLVVIFNFVQSRLFTAVLAGAGLLVLAPAWYIWAGLKLRASTRLKPAIQRGLSAGKQAGG